MNDVSYRYWAAILGYYHALDDILIIGQPITSTSPRHG